MSKNKISVSSNNSYAQALFELATENNVLSEIEKQVNSILVLIKNSEDFSYLIKNPTTRSEDLIKVMRALIKPLTSEMITILGCQVLNETLYLDSQRLTVQLGSNQGISPNMLAITSGKHTPWTVLRVVSVSANTAIVEPLDKARELRDLEGKTVEFMELN